MRATTFALALATLAMLPAPAFADAIEDCNGNKPAVVIQGCSQLIDAGNTSKDATAVALFNRGSAYLDLDKFDKAIADFDASIKLKSDYPDSYFNRAFAYEAMKDFDKAIEDYARVIALTPDNAKAYYARARAYEGKGDDAKALAGYEEAAKLAPNNQSVQKKIAELKQKLGQ